MYVQQRRFKHSKGNDSKCKPKKKEKKKKKKKSKQQECTPYESPNPECRCVVPKIPTILPKLKRLPKFEKKDIDWDNVNRCFSVCQNDRAEEKIKYKTLPPPPLSPCECVEPPIPHIMPKMKRLPKHMREDICWEDLDECIPADMLCKQQVRADSDKPMKRKVLPPLHNSRCPPTCPIEVDKSPKLKRLPKFKGTDPERNCVKERHHCAPRADDKRKYKEHRLPKPPLNDCPPPCIPVPDVAPGLRRLEKVVIEVKRVCPPDPSLCDETLRADHGLGVKRKVLPCLLPKMPVCCPKVEMEVEVEEPPEKPKKPSDCEKKCFSTWAGNRYGNGEFLASKKRYFSTESYSGGGGHMSTYSRDCEQINLPDCERAMDKSCDRRSVVMDDCGKEDAPYPSFSEKGDRKTEEVLSHCRPMDYLQPKRPILPNVVVAQAPPPVHAPIDPELEDECVRGRLRLPPRFGKKTCNDFNEEDEQLLSRDLLKRAEREALEKGILPGKTGKSDSIPGRLAKPNICPVVDLTTCELPVVTITIPDKKDDDYLSCKSKEVKDEEKKICAEKAGVKCIANEFPSPGVEKEVTALAKCGEEEKAKALVVEKCPEVKKDEKPQAATPQNSLIQFPNGNIKNATFKQTLWERIKSFLRAKPNCPRDGQEDPCGFQKPGKVDTCKEPPTCVDKCKKKEAKGGGTTVKSVAGKKAAAPAVVAASSAKDAAQKAPKKTTTSAKEVPPKGYQEAEVCVIGEEKEEAAAKSSGLCLMPPECPSFTLPNCPPRKVCSCDKSRSSWPECKVQETPYISFSECHMFKKLRMNEKQIADLRAKLTLKTFREMQQHQKNRCFCTLAGWESTREFSNRSNHFFDCFEGITEESIQEMDDYQLAEKILDCIKNGLDALEKEYPGEDHPMYEVYKELELITLEELKQCERYLDVRDKVKESLKDDDPRQIVTYSCKFRH